MHVVNWSGRLCLGPAFISKQMQCEEMAIWPCYPTCTPVCFTNTYFLKFLFSNSKYTICWTGTAIHGIHPQLVNTAWFLLHVQQVFQSSKLKIFWSGEYDTSLCDISSIWAVKPALPTHMHYPYLCRCKAVKIVQLTTFHYLIWCSISSIGRFLSCPLEKYKYTYLHVHASQFHSFFFYVLICFTIKCSTACYKTHL